MTELSAVIVDSSASYCNSVAISLKEMGIPQDRIFITKRYEGAVEFINEKKPQLLITEFQVDGKFGLELVNLHASQNANNISVIMTHNNSSSSIAEAAEELVDDYIVKPFQSGMLHQRLRSLINKKLNPSDYIQRIRDGKQMLIEGRLQDAEHLFSEALGKESKPTLAHYYLGYTKYIGKNLSVANAEFVKGLKLQPLHYKCLTGKFDTFFEQKSYDEAYKVASTIIDNYPIGPKRLANLFISAVFSGQLDAVPEYFKLFAELDHKPPELRKVFAAALFTAGRSQINRQDLAKAGECFELGIKVIGPDPEYLTKVIKVLLKTDAMGHRHASKILQQFPNTQIGTKAFENLQFLVQCKILPVGDLIDRGRKLAANKRLDAESYEVFVNILLENRKITLAEDITAKALKEYPEMRDTLSMIYEKFQGIIS
ncbi:MAG: response regulator [Bdellovibrio sp.]|nr:response regulator [Bdellovibrio sp.]